MRRNKQRKQHLLLPSALSGDSHVLCVALGNGGVTCDWGNTGKAEQ